MSSFQGTSAALLDVCSVCLWLPLVANSGASAYLGLCFLLVVEFCFSLWAEMLPPTPLTLIQPYHAHTRPA